MKLSKETYLHKHETTKKNKLKIVTLFMMAIIPGSHASMCILFRASEGGGLSWHPIKDK
jgi:hypothetical protein